MAKNKTKKGENHAKQRNAFDPFAAFDLYLRRKRQSDDGEFDLDHSGFGLLGRGKSKRNAWVRSIALIMKQLFL